MKQLVYILFLLSMFVVSLNAKELEKVSLQLQWLNQFQFAGYYVAKEKGFYKDVGLDVEIKEFNSGIDVAKDVTLQKSTYGIGRSSLILKISDDIKIKLLSAIFQSSPSVFISTKKSEISNIKDFKDKRIMMTNDEVNDVSLRAMLTQNHLSIKNIKILKHSFNIDDLINNKTDLMASYISNEPYLLKQKGVDINIFDPKKYGFDFYSDILFTSNHEILNHKQRAIKFNNASLKGWRYAFSHIDETVDMILKKYNSQNKSKEALLYEAKELKKLAYYKTKKIGYIDIVKLQRMYDIYNVMALVSTEIKVSDLLVRDDKKEYFKDKRSIKICVMPDNLPYSEISKGKYIGMSADYLDLVSKRTNITFTLVPTKNWIESLKYVENRKCDLLPIVVKTPSRTEYLNFTDIVFSTPLVIATKNTEVYISDIKKILDKRLGVAKGHSYIELLKSIYPNIKLVEVNTNKEGLKKVANGTIYAMIGDLASMAYEIQRNNTNNLKISGSIDDGLDIRMGVRNDDIPLFNTLNKAIDSISEKEIQSIYNKWISVEYKKRIDYTLVIIISIFFIIMILFGIYRHRELNRHNKNLQETQDNFNLGQEIASIGIWIFNHKLKTLTWTDGVHMIFGTDKNSFKVTSESFFSFVHAEDKEKVSIAYRDAIKNHIPYFVEHRIILDNSEIKYVEERSNNFYDTDGNILKSIGTVLDVTDRKRVQRKLSELNSTLEYRVEEEVKNSRYKDQQMLHQSRLAQMGEMISMIAHQWRQPLGAISATAIDMKIQMELETFDSSNDDDIKLCHDYFMNSLNNIDGFVKGLTSTIDDFRNFYKPNKESLLSDINSPLNTALKIVRQNLASKEIEIEEEYDVKKDVEMFKNELVQVFLNILKNAQDNFIERGIEDAKIKISTQNLPTGVILEVCDNGGGIPEDIIDKIFDPYFSTKDEKNGSGLGLYMSKMIVEEHHHAKLRVFNYNDSQGFCIGACFSIELNNKINMDYVLLDSDLI